MNELQIRLTADIQGLQSALAKAKQTLKSFETETSTDSEKSNVGFRRKIGLIEQLTAKAKQLKVSLSQATNEQQIASFNAQLEETNAELTRLNALGKSFANTSVQSFNKFRVSAGAAGGSAIAFNRIIQDAPFGIIGVGNNIQQFAEQLAAVKSEYISARSKDINDLGEQLVKNMSASSSSITYPGKPSIIVASEIKPYVAASLDRKLLLGFVVEQGSTISHAAILARALRIPAVVKCVGIIDRVQNGTTLVVDGS